MGGKLAPLERISKMSRESWRKLFMWLSPDLFFLMNRFRTPAPVPGLLRFPNKNPAK
jgi:hypothetical protein